MKSWDIELQQGKKANETKIITGSLPSQKAKRSKQKKRKFATYPLRKSSILDYSLFPTTKSPTFFLISVKMDLESKVTGFQFVSERSMSCHEGF